MRKFLIYLALIMAVLMVTRPAIAAFFGDDGEALQTVLDDITLFPPGQSSVDVTEDEITDGIDAYWSLTASGGAIETIIVELASWADDNLFGVYDGTNSGNSVQIFDGLASEGAKAAISIDPNGSVFLNFSDTGIDFAGNNFGFYLDARSHADFQPDSEGNFWYGGIWYSDTSLNDDNMDHMYVYRGEGDTIQVPGALSGTWTNTEYILAFEDLPYEHWGDQDGTDEGYPEWSDTEPDFTDFVVIIESIEPIPEPGTLLLLGLGLVAIAGISSKKFMG